MLGKGKVKERPLLQSLHPSTHSVFDWSCLAKGTQSNYPCQNTNFAPFPLPNRSPSPPSPHPLRLIHTSSPPPPPPHRPYPDQTKANDLPHRGFSPVRSVLPTTRGFASLHPVTQPIEDGFGTAGRERLTPKVPLLAVSTLFTCHHRRGGGGGGGWG